MQKMGARRKGLSAFQWLVRDYCEELNRIRVNAPEYENEVLKTHEERRADVHEQIAKYLDCDKEIISPVLHSITFNGDTGYNFMGTARTLLDMKADGVLD